MQIRAACRQVAGEVGPASLERAKAEQGLGRVTNVARLASDDAPGGVGRDPESQQTAPVVTQQGNVQPLAIRAAHFGRQPDVAHDAVLTEPDLGQLDVHLEVPAGRGRAGRWPGRLAAHLHQAAGVEVARLGLQPLPAVRVRQLQRPVEGPVEGKIGDLETAHATAVPATRSGDREAGTLAVDGADVPAAVRSPGEVETHGKLAARRLAPLHVGGVERGRLQVEVQPP